jgi:hypothetical protein
MTTTQKALWTKRIRELLNIGDEIEKLYISDEWIELFTHMAFYRGWVRLTQGHKNQIVNIAMTNSKAVLFLAQQGKKVGLSMLERLSLIEDERIRLKAVGHIIAHGITGDSKNGLELIIASATNRPNLFDF